MKSGIGTSGISLVDPSWDLRAGGDAPIRWSFDSGGGTLQGPLEMASFRDRSVLVTLEPGQVGLLVESGDVRAVFLEGAHCLRVGDEPGRVDPRARLVVLQTERPLAVIWGADVPWRVPGADGAPETPPRGSAAVAIVDPVLFHSAFLRHAESCDEPFVRRLIGTLLQARVEGLLAGPAGAPSRSAASPAEAVAARGRLAALAPADLNASLAAYGIACVAFTVDAAAPALTRREREPRGARPGLRPPAAESDAMQPELVGAGNDNPFRQR